MDQETKYLARVFPQPWRVCGRLLHAFTLGHAHVLAASTKWRPFGKVPEDPAFLPLGLFVATRPWRQAADGIRMVRPAERFAAFLGFSSFALRVDVEEKREVFAEYLEASTSFPDLRPTPAMPGQVRTRRAGAPLLARLRMFGMRELGLGASAMDLPFVDLAWMFAAAFEDDGRAYLVNDTDDDFDRYCREQEEIRKQGKGAVPCGT